MSLTKTERIEALETEIAEITIAISQIRKAGQSYTIKSSSGAGTERTVTMADYDTLVKERERLRAEVNALEGTRSVRIRAGW